ncbi:MAG: glycosyltransferase family 4 protein [Planctomycetota bacterium]
MMRILLLNQTFHPDVAATAQHGMDLARHLVSRGHQVSVIASRSMYGEKGSALPAFEIIDGIEIHRVGVNRFGKSGGIFGRLVDFASWYLLALGKAVWLPKFDVVVPFTTPPFVVLIAHLLRRYSGCRVVYWVMDLYPDVPVLHGILNERGLLTRVLERLHRRLLRRSDRVIALGRCMADRLRAKGVPDDRIALVRVWADRNEVQLQPPTAGAYRREWAIDDDRFIVMYSGNFGIMHEATTLLEAAARFDARGGDSASSTAAPLFVFVGGGARMKEARAFAEERGLGNVMFQPYQPRERLGELLTTANAHLISMIDGAEGLIVPCKLFGILAAARPALFVGPKASEIARVIDETGCGDSIATGDVNGLVAAIARLVESPADEVEQIGYRGRRALEETYDRSLACAAIESVLVDVDREHRQRHRRAEP